MGLRVSTQSISLTWLNVLITIAIVLGIGFRFYNLDHKVYWFDETMTSLRISGWDQATLVESAYTGQPISVKDFVATYQYPAPNIPWEQTIKALASHPEHSPLYYLGLRGWLQFVPHSIGNLRMFSAWISLLVLPLIYWLARELFTESRVARIAIGLAAISPFHVNYAQEAREYSLWTVAILFSSAVLLHVCKKPKHLRQQPFSAFPWWWMLYGLSVALLLYSQPFSAFVLLAHGLYILYESFIQQQFALLRSFLAAIFGGILGFLPWLWIVLQNFKAFLENTNHTAQNLDTSLVLYWARNISRIFFDVNQGTSLINPTIYIFLWLMGISLWFLWSRGNRSSAIFLFLLMGTIALSLMVPDILLGGRRSHSMRYFVPSIVGLELSVAYLLSNKLKVRQISQREFIRWRNGTIGLFLGGLLSISISSQVDNWWTKSAAKSGYHPEIAKFINAAVSDDKNKKNPSKIAIMSDEGSGQILSLSHLLNPDIDLILCLQGSIPSIPAPISKRYDRVFVYRSSDLFQQKISEHYRVQLKSVKKWLVEAH